jgi:HD-GYP domain-containing protein (c-di-GMP phosphodiesterase class II)
MASDSDIRKKLIQSKPTDQTRRFIAHSQRTTSRTNPDTVRKTSGGDRDSMSENQIARARLVTKQIQDWEDTTQELRKTNERLRKILDATIQAMARTVEVRDPYTAGHQRRVTDLACAIGVEMGLSGDKIYAIRTAGAIHDIGMISVPAEILSKTGKLTEIEFGMIKSHPQVGYEILKEIDFPWDVARIVLQHHERTDGSGYPQSIRGKDILLEARIIGLADVVEAMASHRPYRPALGIEKALEEILRNRDTLYYPEITDACLRLFRQKGFKLKA